MSLLAIDACPRGALSRTKQLLDAFLEGFGGPAERVDLPGLTLPPYDGAMVDHREALVDAGHMDDPLFALARQFSRADQIVIAAPYWDLSFPAMLKTYIEHIFARTVTFVYDESGPVGLCRAKRLAYLTTSGSPIATGLNLGGDYLAAVGRMLGIPQFDQVSAEGLDIAGADVHHILEGALGRARILGAAFARHP